MTLATHIIDFDYMSCQRCRSDDTLTLARLTAVQNICPIYIIKVGQQFCEMSLYENTEELFGGFEENDYLCIRYLTY